MYKVASLGLLAILAAMIVPASFETNSNVGTPTFYGYSVMSLVDASGITVYESGVHNEVISSGVDFIMDQVFNDAAASVADADSVDAICINVNPRFDQLFQAGNETISLADYLTNDGDPANSNVPCIGQLEFVTTAAGADGIANAVSPTSNFAAGGVALDNDQTIFGIAICETVAASQADCEFPLLALVDTADIIVAAGETVDITYTMTLD